MPVIINEIIIRAIITNDDNKTSASPRPGKAKDETEEKFEMLELIEEMIKNKNER